MDDAALDAYLSRIGVTRAGATLEAIAWGHVTSIPFENLDIVLGRPIRIDLPSIVDKLVIRRRGGYCFEQNALLAAALARLGHQVTTLQARVRWMATGPTPRTHMLLAVDGRWLVDGGFGGACPSAPIPLEVGVEVAQRQDRYRLAREGDVQVLQMWIDGAWAELYAFTMEPALPVDYEVANHYTSTHPQSRFVLGPTAARVLEDGRIAVRGAEVTRRRGAAVERETIVDGERLLEILAGELGLLFPPGTRFRGGPP